MIQNIQILNDSNQYLMMMYIIIISNFFEIHLYKHYQIIHIDNIQSILLNFLFEHVQYLEENLLHQ